jgi:hypothetical protein
MTKICNLCEKYRFIKGGLPALVQIPNSRIHSYYVEMAQMEKWPNAVGERKLPALNAMKREMPEFKEPVFWLKHSLMDFCIDKKKHFEF